MPRKVDAKFFRLYEGDRVSGLITWAEGRRMLAAEPATAECDVEPDGKTLCFRRILPEQPVRFLRAAGVVEFESSVDPSSCAFSVSEVMAIAGSNFRHGRSRTARMTDEQRANRKGRFDKPLPPEDLVERAKNKQEEWARLGPSFSDLVRVSASLSR